MAPNCPSQNSLFLRVTDTILAKDRPVHREVVSASNLHVNSAFRSDSAQSRGVGNVM